jgi:hypothetical protein
MIIQKAGMAIVALQRGSRSLEHNAALCGGAAAIDSERTETACEAFCGV